MFQWIEKELEEERACLSIPFCLLLLFLFIYMEDHHLAQYQVRGVEESLRNYLDNGPAFGFSRGDDVVGHKTMRDVYSVADLYSWLAQGLFPALHVESYPVSEGEETAHFILPATGEFLTYNSIIGGLRFQQRVVPLSTCKIPDNFAPMADCYGSNQFWRPPERHQLLPVSPDVGVREEYFLLTDPRSEWVLKLRDLEFGCNTTNCRCDCDGRPWIDASTLQVEVSFVSLNREVGLWSIVNCNFIFSRGGRIWSSISVESQLIDPYSENAWLLRLQEIVWIAFNLAVFIFELREFFTDLREVGLRSLFRQVFKYLSDPWNVVDICTIITSAVLITSWVAQVVRSNQLAGEFPSYSPFTQTSLEEFFLAVHRLTELELYVRVCFSVYALIITLRLFKGFSANPRLGLLTGTLRVVSVDVIHFLFVFVTIFLSFGAAGLSMFGRQMDEFSTFQESIHTLYRILIGDFFWGQMKVIGTIPAAVFFWIFTIVVVLLMLNMLLALIIDAYSNVKRDSLRSETLWSQASETFLRWYQKKTKKRVGLKYVWKCLINSAGEAKTLKGRRKLLIDANPCILALEDLMARCPGLGAQEGIEILSACYEEYCAKEDDSEISILTSMVAKLTHEVGLLRQEADGRMDSARNLSLTNGSFVEKIEGLVDTIGQRVEKQKRSLEAMADDFAQHVDQQNLPILSDALVVTDVQVENPHNVRCPTYCRS